MTTTIWSRRLGVAAVVTCGLALSGCAGTVPTHDTPDWPQLIEEVQSELDALQPDEPVQPTTTVPPDDPYASLTRTSPNAVPTNFEDVEKRECLLYPYDEAGALQDVVQVVPCVEPHYGEVYAVGEFTDDEWSEELDYTVQLACEEEFEDYIGIDYWSSELYFDYSYTSEYGWSQGLRSWRCYVIEADYEYTGSLEGTHR